MNKNLLIIIVLIGLFVVGSAAYAIRQKSTSDALPVEELREKQEVKEEAAAPDEIDITGNYLDLLNQNKNLKCTFSGETEGTKTEGVTYIAGNKMHGDFQIEVEGKTMDSHIVSDGTYMYSWASNMPQGMKVKIDEVKKLSEEMVEDISKAEQEKAMKEFQQDYDYKCTTWSVDESQFELPTNVNFIDSTELMKNVPEIDNGNLCAACDLVQDAAGKAQCKAQLNCE